MKVVIVFFSERFGEHKKWQISLRNNNNLPLSVYTSFPPPTLFESPRDFVVVWLIWLWQENNTDPSVKHNYLQLFCIHAFYKRVTILGSSGDSMRKRMTYPDWCKTPVNWYRMSISSGVIWLMICADWRSSSLVTGSLRWPPVAFR